jgi:hypothetical protein
MGLDRRATWRGAVVPARHLDVSREAIATIGIFSGGGKFTH